MTRGISMTGDECTYRETTLQAFKIPAFGKGD